MYTKFTISRYAYDYFGSYYIMTRKRFYDAKRFVRILTIQICRTVYAATCLYPVHEYTLSSARIVKMLVGRD